MKMIILTQFCCGCSVKTGTIIIGVFDLVAAAILIAIFGLEANSKGLDSVTNELLLIDLLPNIISMFLSAALVYGACKGLTNFIWPWLVYYLVYIILILISGTAQVVHSIILSQFALGIEILLLLLITFALLVYFYVTVHSHYRNLVDCISEPPRPPVVVLV